MEHLGQVRAGDYSTQNNNGGGNYNHPSALS